MYEVSLTTVQAMDTRVTPSRVIVDLELGESLRLDLQCVNSIVGFLKLVYTGKQRQT